MLPGAQAQKGRTSLLPQLPPCLPSLWGARGSQDGDPKLDFMQRLPSMPLDSIHANLLNHNVLDALQRCASVDGASAGVQEVVYKFLAQFL